MKNRLQNHPSAHAAAGLWPLVERSRQPALPPLMFERLSFLADLDVIEHFNFDAWYAAIEDMHQLSPVEIK